MTDLHATGVRWSWGGGALIGVIIAILAIGWCPGDTVASDDAAEVDAMTGVSPVARSPEARVATEPIDITRLPDPIAEPAATWSAVATEFGRARWAGISLALLIVARAWRKRMTPVLGESHAVGWRSWSLAVSAAVISIAGPLVEAAAGAGGWGAVVTGVALAVGLVWDRVDPPRLGRRAEGDR